jgi:hypothetical protein
MCSYLTQNKVLYYLAYQVNNNFNSEMSRLIKVVNNLQYVLFTEYIKLTHNGDVIPVNLSARPYLSALIYCLRDFI